MDLFLVGCKDAEAARQRVLKMLTGLVTSGKVDCMYIVEDFSIVWLKKGGKPGARTASTPLVFWHRAFPNVHALLSEQFAFGGSRVAYWFDGEVVGTL